MLKHGQPSAITSDWACACVYPGSRHVCVCCSGEVGDTWVHGIASDPGRMADYRAVLRARRDCEAATHCDSQVGSCMWGRQGAQRSQ
jgi:hypothetical protein